ncbi:MAG TPA: ATP-dependent DNA helicase RecG [Verrucomicrobiales bacterium]|nr:ATP-dependent DNA helicase RecG [Verrucomicrobiales bacterium]
MELTLQSPLQQVPGIGTIREPLLRKLKLVTIGDLLRHRPRRHEDRRHPTPISQAVKGQSMLVRGTLTAHGVNRFKQGRKSVYEFVLDDGTGRLHCRYWNLPYLEDHFAVGMDVFAYGAISGGKPVTMDHPEYEVVTADDDAPLHLNRIVPVHRLTEGLSGRWLRALIWRLLESVRIAPDPLERMACDHFSTSLPTQFRRLHFPDSMEHVESARRFFALSEFLHLQRGFADRRQAFRARAAGHSCSGDNRLIRPLLRNLGFALTEAQKRVLREIRSDLGHRYPMRRLLHGDVGAGKTVVAACAALMSIESGYSVALMAPTEILAEQHFRRLAGWFASLGIRVELLTGKLKESTGPGTADVPTMTVGTHALVHDGYQPDDLGLVIIDEQHRFGVVQRDKLVRKGWYPHLLVMTATPIPRTLGLAAYGDLEISVLDEIPARRGRVRTFLRTSDDTSRIWSFVAGQLAAGRQAYVVFPRIDEDDSPAGLKSVIEEHDRLSGLLKPHSIGLLHGRMPSADCRQVMDSFCQNKIQALVATTVIEVGLDVPNATVMVIGNAGQYGLSQLHQLRGRIGRGTGDSYCILVEDSRKTDAVERLKVLMRSNDGFEIAEEDMRLRGVGDFLGTRQSGMPKFRFADLLQDADLLQLARRLVEANPPQPKPLANRPR